MRSRKGLAWNKRAFTESDHFELQFAFKVTGQGRVGGDGLAIWYTAQQGNLGPVFGANDFWTGMAIMLDSFDNDGARNNPAISLMINDGTRAFDHPTDGSHQVLSTCQRDFRNKQYPVHMKVEYYRNVLTVFVSDGMSPTPRFDICIRAEHIFLPKAGFFGVSAATGGLADDHDVLDFSVFSLFTDTAQLERAKQQLASEERTRAQAEFERQQQDYEKERQKFARPLGAVS
uniref:L-type lectin-like domain-containing protein n=1 Tax=Globodera pallida TaxID=36090 RepID=A0A183BXI2_GLOPA